MIVLCLNLNSNNKLHLLHLNHSSVSIFSDSVLTQARPGRRDRPTVAGQGTQRGHTLPSSQPQDLGGTAETENSEESLRYLKGLDDY